MTVIQSPDEWREKNSRRHSLRQQLHEEAQKPVIRQPLDPSLSLTEKFAARMAENEPQRKIISNLSQEIRQLEAELDEFDLVYGKNWYGWWRA